MTIILGFPQASQIIELPLGLEDVQVPEAPTGIVDQF